MGSTKRRSAKFACSVDARLFARVERMRASTGESRSAVVSRALVALTSEDLFEAKVRRYVEAYREVPETPAAVARARRLAERALKALPWDDDR